MHNKSNVCILLATFNGSNWLQQQVTTIINQEGVHSSIFISDDGSNELSLSLLHRVFDDNKNAAFLHFEKSGSAGQNFFRLLRDVCFDEKFDYVAFADQDDIWHPNKLQLAIKILKENSADGYSSNVMAFWPDGKKKLINKAQSQQKYDYMFESAGPGCTFVLSRKLALELQTFLKKHRDACKEIALHDWFTYAFARSKGYTWIIDKVPNMLYRQHQDNVVGANVGMNAKKLRWKRLREGWYRNQVVQLARLLEYDNKLPIKALLRYNLSDRLYLIINFRKFRRSFIDALSLVIFLLLPIKR